MTIKSLTFQNANGENLSARLDFPEDQAPIAFALLAHCFTCTKNSKTVANINKALKHKGIAVLRFDFSGLGESEGEFSETNFSSNVADLIAAAEYIRKFYQVPKLLIGHSFGGTACLQAAVEISGVSAVAAIGAPAEPRHIERFFAPIRQQIFEMGEAKLLLAQRPIRIKRQFLEDIENVNMEALLTKLKCALLILHSPIDEVVSIENAALTYRMARHPKSFVSLDTADHMLSDPKDAAYCGRMIAEWASRYIA